MIFTVRIITSRRLKLEINKHVIEAVFTKSDRRFENITVTGKKYKYELSGIVALYVVGLLLRLWFLNSYSLDSDEMLSLIRVENGLRVVLTGEEVKYNPPVYEMIVWAVMSVGLSVGHAKILLAAVCALLSPMAYVTGKRYFSAEAGAAGAIMTMVSQPTCYTAALIRGYGLSTLFALVALYFLYDVLRGKRYLSFLLFIVASIYTHYYSAVALIPMVIYAALKAEKRIPAWVASVGVLLSLPAAVMIVSGILSRNSQYPLSGLFISRQLYQIFVITIAAGGVMGPVVLALVAKSYLKNRNVISSIAVFAIVATVVASAFFRTREVYVTCILPFVWLAFSEAAFSDEGGKRNVMKTLITLTIISQLGLSAYMSYRARMDLFAAEKQVETMRAECHGDVYFDRESARTLYYMASRRDPFMLNLVMKDISSMSETRNQVIYSRGNTDNLLSLKIANPDFQQNETIFPDRYCAVVKRDKSVKMDINPFSKKMNDSFVNKCSQLEENGVFTLYKCEKEDF